VEALSGANAVLLADQFNPSILSEHWLVRHGIIPDEPGAPDRVFVPGLVSVATTDFVLHAVPQRVQFSLRRPAEDGQAILEATLGSVVDLLPHTPYRAMGLNFSWSCVAGDRAAFASGLRAAFAPDGTVLGREFPEADARFGAYASRDVLAMRMRLDVKPVHSELGGQAVEGLAYEFNFHKDLDPDCPVEGIRDAIARWTEARGLSQCVFEATTRWVPR
jgi:hypothetical protein